MQRKHFITKQPQITAKYIIPELHEGNIMLCGAMLFGSLDKLNKILSTNKYKSFCYCMFYHL